MSHITNKIYKYTMHSNRPKILDVGIGSGKKLRMIKNYISCDIYGADIEEWG